MIWNNAKVEKLGKCYAEDDNYIEKINDVNIILVG